MRLEVALVLAAALAGCLALADDLAGSQREVATEEETQAEGFAFADPTQVNPEGDHGFEPSLDVANNGTIYVTAPRSNTSEPPSSEDWVQERSSFLWYSDDGGGTFASVPSPGQAHESLTALEGDIATDDEGRLYFVDMYLADSTLSRWAPSPSGPSWELTRPAIGTAGPDDRPWIEATGDGIVYYLAWNGRRLPSPGDDVTQPTIEEGGSWAYVSTDGGRTFSPQTVLERTWFCTPAEDPTDPTHVFAACGHTEEKPTGDLTLASPEGVIVYELADDGTIVSSQRVAQLEGDLVPGYTTMALTPEGTPYVVWAERESDDEQASDVIRYAAPDGNAWITHDITPFEGSFENVWATAGSGDRLDIGFYATPDTQLDDESEWYVHVGRVHDASQADPDTTFQGLDPEPVITGPNAPPDFLQTDIGPRDEMHIVYERRQANATGTWPGNIFHTHEIVK